MENDERRQCSRVNQQGTFQFRKCGEDEVTGMMLDGQLIDYSLAGIRFVTNERLEKNTSLLIELDLDHFQEDTKEWRRLWQTKESEYLNVIGSVMWCRWDADRSGEFEVGTRFVEKV